ncbi:hypothetical protein PR003_g18564 [Phytophthora rubi]|uniref:Secreted protein n=1 Tax=Phytophthora rubi TaxID=129364 RepID=A0A6A3JCF5_9STRA|nr:hypothetical protein PR002_g21500 [Phytophthora rubi]KAE8991643.1 hypothetical protein PR001_g21166 [Phytophthora rubi]KAE9317076.1 hypothetical protein PR003_g18564 [Phytophthora rubi]
MIFCTARRRLQVRWGRRPNLHLKVCLILIGIRVLSANSSVKSRCRSVMQHFTGIRSRELRSPTCLQVDQHLQTPSALQKENRVSAVLAGAACRA